MNKNHSNIHIKNNNKNINNPSYYIDINKHKKLTNTRNRSFNHGIHVISLKKLKIHRDINNINHNKNDNDNDKSR